MFKEKNPTIKVDLSEFGDCAGIPFFAVIRNPRLLSYGERQEIGKNYKTAKTDADHEANGRLYIKALIVSTNLTDPDKPDTDEPLNIDSPDCIAKLPAEIVDRLTQVIMPGKGEKTKNS